jgi:hypothetical protein
MAQPRDFDLAGLELMPGDHLCAIFVGQQERDDIVVPYVRAGLRAGDKCICIVDETPLDGLLAQIGEQREVESYVASRQLEVHTAGDVYLRTSPFSVDAVLAFWDSTVRAAVVGGPYGFARGAGEPPVQIMSTPSERSEFFRYEAAVNRFAPRYPQTMVCLYDLQRFGGGIIVDLLRTHPKLLMGGLILENPHYREPEDLAALPH